MRIVCVSDTHTMMQKVVVPDGDVLIHAGDMTFTGTVRQITAELRRISLLPHKHKIVIAGNHDLFLDEKGFPHRTEFRNWRIDRYVSVESMLDKFPGITYLQDSGCEIEGVKFYGSPWTTAFYGWAFQLESAQQAKDVWAKIPSDTNVLVTHQPPLGILDQSYTRDGRLGCEQLRYTVMNNLLNLRLHVFGHIHEAHGRVDYEPDLPEESPLTFVNAAINTREYTPTNAPIVVDI